MGIVFQKSRARIAQCFSEMCIRDSYRLGIDPYLNVITAETALFTNQQTAVSLRIQQMTASVQLVEAVGGGWDGSQLPSAGLMSAPLAVPKPDSTAPEKQ